MKAGAGLTLGAALGGHRLAAAQDGESLISIPEPQVELPTEDITFRWVDSGGLKQFFFNAFFPEYEKVRPNITVDYQVLPWPKIGEVVPLGVRSGNAQDVFQVPTNVSGAQAVREGWVQPLDDLIPDFANWKASFPSGVFLPGINDFDGKTYGFPLWSTQRYATLTLFNRAYMQKAGYDPEETPLTWDQFRDAAKKITEQGGGSYYGLIIGGAQTGRWGEFVGNLARMAGASAAPDNMDWRTGEYVYTSDEYLAAIDLLLALNEDGSFFPGTLSLNAQQARGQFPQGVAGMILQGPWNIPEWESASPDFDFGVASQPVPNSGDPLPLTVAPGSGDLLWVFKESPYGAVAGDIFSYVGGIEGQTALLQLSGGSSPVLLPEVNEKAENVGPRSKTVLDIFAEQVRVGPDPHVRNPDIEAFDLEYRDISPNFGEVVQGIFAGQLSDPKAAMQDLKDRSDAELDRAIKAAQDNGAVISRDAWVFPNWHPEEDYTQEDYEAL
jgi:multiple sugar transport system substrate-binding protein